MYVELVNASGQIFKGTTDFFNRIGIDNELKILFFVIN